MIFLSKLYDTTRCLHIYNTSIKRYLPTLNRSRFWLGYTDRLDAGVTYRCLDGTASPYTSWAEGQPACQGWGGHDAHEDRGMRCVYYWYYTKRPYICKRRKNILFCFVCLMCRNFFVKRLHQLINVCNLVKNVENSIIDIQYGCAKLSI